MSWAAIREAPAGLESPWHRWPRLTHQASLPGGWRGATPNTPDRPPAICSGLRALIQEAIAGAQWAVADVQKPDRIVIGSSSPAASEAM